MNNEIKLLHERKVCISNSEVEIDSRSWNLYASEVLAELHAHRAPEYEPTDSTKCAWPNDEVSVLQWKLQWLPDLNPT